ncbi:MAG: hypothetical protein EOM12_06585 [Verrucomicrobiae bacterium]|nr:hypothetical protein [Verrucomicrobiae bacterium]
MVLIKFILSLYLMATIVAFFIAILLGLMGRLIKVLNIQELHPASIPGTPPGQIMPPAAEADLTEIAVAIAVAKRENAKYSSK